ncbi:MAG TPA: sigma-70 family RNA polymerase sigma factor, partial [Opitutaceae bacterium]|nr:sigma-70 family RNA polymerase sigma factor [Opitutaceae bacterium]
MIATVSQPGLGFRSPRAATGTSERAIISGQAAEHDAELVRRVNAGDGKAFEEIVARHRERVFSVALGHLQNRCDAEEITQDTFVRAHRGLSRFRGDSSLATWLHRIAFNLSRNRHKYYFCRRRHETMSIDCAIGGDNQAPFSEVIASDAPSPAREAASREFSELVAVGMRSLCASQRDILMLRNGLNHSYGEIAQALGISIGTV